MPFTKAYIIPILIGLWFPITFSITYTIAVLNKDVVPVFPYISDTGTWTPESCIFGQLLNMGAILMGLAMYIRYRQVREVIQKSNLDKSIQVNNERALIIGTVAAIGVSLVANFQETNVLSVHIIGAFFAFTIGTVYEILQTIISFKLTPTFGSTRMNNVRAFLTALTVLTNTLTSVCAGIAYFKFTGDDITKWGKDDGAFGLHLTSTINEWILVLSVLFYMATYTGEFKMISISEPPIQMST